MVDFESLFREILASPIRSYTWRIIVAHPELYSDEGMVFLERMREEAKAGSDHAGVSGISSNMYLFNRCREVGIERAFFGTRLSDECRDAFSRVTHPRVVQQCQEAVRLFRLDRFDDAGELFESVLQDLDGDEHPLLRAEVEHQLGFSLLRCQRGSRADNIERMIRIFNSLSGFWDRLDILAERIRSRINLGIAYQNRLTGDQADNIESAIELYAWILDNGTPEAFPFEWASTLTNMSVAFRRRLNGSRAANLERAIELARESSAIWTRDEYPDHWARFQHNLALLYRHRLRGDNSVNAEEALRCYEAALTIWTENDQPFRWSTAVNNLAAVYEKRLRGDRAGNLEKAIDLYRRSLRVRTEEAFPRYWAITTSNMAVCYGDRLRGDRDENLEKANELLEATLRIRRVDSSKREHVKTLFNLAYVNYFRKRGGRRRNLERSVRLYEEYIRLADPVDDTRSHILVLNYLALALIELEKCGGGSFSERVLELLKEAFELADIRSFPRECRGTVVNLTGILLGRGDLRGVLDTAETGRKADRYLQGQATSITGRTRETEEGSVLYYHASLASARLGDITGALEWLEQGRTRELGESLERDRRLFDTEIREGDRRDYLEIVEQLRELEAEQRGMVPGGRPFLAIAEEVGGKFEEFESLIGRIQTYAPEFFKTERITLNQVETLLADEKTCLLVCNVTAHGSAVFLLAVSGGSLVTETSFSGEFTMDRMAAITEAWRSGLNNSEKELVGDIIEDTARSLFEELFAGAFGLLDEKFQGIERLVMVPHLLLHILPLHLMKHPSVVGRRYLLEDYELSFAPGVSVLLTLSQVAPARMDDVLIVTDPTDDLDWSMMEAESVEKHFPGKVRRLAGAGATRATFVDGAKEADVLHLVCHGFFDPEDPWSSGIILAGQPDTGREGAPLEEPVAASREDPEQTPLEKSAAVSRDSRNQTPSDETGEVPRGDRENLTLKEITYGIDLSGVELVVLSACETGLVSPGDGSDEFIGLPGGFLRAGARTVVASLWSVDDLSTSLLMAEFYRLMKDEGLSPLQALKKAQSGFINNPSWNNPYYWGAFRIFGM